MMHTVPQFFITFCTMIIHMWIALHSHRHIFHQMPYHHLIRHLRAAIDRLFARITGEV